MRGAFAWRLCSYTNADWEARKSWQSRLAEGWHEVVSVPSIELVLEENGLGESREGGGEGGGVQGELFGLENPRQLLLNLGANTNGAEQPVVGRSAWETQDGTGQGNVPG